MDKLNSHTSCNCVDVLYMDDAIAVKQTHRKKKREIESNGDRQRERKR